MTERDTLTDREVQTEVQTEKYRQVSTDRGN